MSDATPDYVLYSIWNNSRGIGPGPTVTQKEWKAIAKEQGGWFMYWGAMIDMRAVSIGGGMYQIKGTNREGYKQ